jgi:hypothetical protein
VGQVKRQGAKLGSMGGEWRDSTADFVRQMGYREYARYLSFHFPFTHERALLEHLRAAPWNFDQRHFKARSAPVPSVVGKGNIVADSPFTWNRISCASCPSAQPARTGSERFTYIQFIHFMSSTQASTRCGFEPRTAATEVPRMAPRDQPN